MNSTEDVEAISAVLNRVDERHLFPDSALSDTEFLTRLRTEIAASEAPEAARIWLTSRRLFIQLSAVCVVVFALVARFGGGTIPVGSSSFTEIASLASSGESLDDFGPTTGDIAELAAAEIPVDTIAAALGVADIHIELDLTDSEEPTTGELLELDDTAIAAVMDGLESTEFF